MKKRNAILLGVFAIVGVVSSVFILARTLPMDSIRIKSEFKVLEKPITKTGPYQRGQYKPWDDLEKEKKDLLKKEGITKKMVKKRNMTPEQLEVLLELLVEKNKKP